MIAQFECGDPRCRHAAGRCAHGPVRHPLWKAMLRHVLPKKQRASPKA